MPNPTLTEDQRTRLFEPIFRQVTEMLKDAAGDDASLGWALRRKLVKELGYLERSRPAVRNKLKADKWREQDGKCAICGKELAQKYSELDRYEAQKGYTKENTRLVHRECHILDQEDKGYM
jgi:ribosomal protein L44E